MDYTKFMTERSKARNPSAIRALIPYMNREDMISLGAGQPNPETFPFESMTVKLKSGEIMEMDPQLFQRALSYDLTSGLPPLNQWLRQLQTIEHAPPCDFDISVGSGSQDLLTKALEMMTDTGEAVMVEDPTYTGALAFLETLNCTLAPVATDQYGLVPDALESLLANWPATNPSGRQDQSRPRVLYTIPSGGNPTGISSSFERKKQIYDICHKYDIMILEDDAYYYLQFDEKRIPSYLSIDVDGRVLRCDSMSKILSSGLRLGWVTGPKPLIERMNMHTMVTNLQPSGLSQLMAYELLKLYGHQGFFEHVHRVANFYKEKRDLFVECLEKHMKDYAEWVVPQAGMFVWLKLKGIKDSQDLIMTKAIEKKVVAVPGLAFMPINKVTPFVRVSYSNVNQAQMDEALSRLAEAIAEANECK
ncbi:pyridoxal phosphate-dependent transferase [Radiomyces spectabilis]|uniref:pyridoxal phosphate-dependent transferase n=1 Tax=Radiomyces spectabilis TaxID=64574 RepID=UPI00222030C0|nr:pyridoxal phosphate-dependent transferase [Radiomyces spectabilis]KAI8371567.1 pyridoxal phosphate-dependent transferase [Radiomyces spectabilis]